MNTFDNQKKELTYDDIRECILPLKSDIDKNSQGMYDSLLGIISCNEGMNIPAKECFDKITVLITNIAESQLNN